MQHIHLIAIGGAAMHNLAIALHKKGYKVTGSDDEIFEPSRSRLDSYGLLPKHAGWDESLINKDISAIIVGMHARKDNPELLKAKELELKIFSYPEYLYEQTRHKKRVVIGGSHGKTTTTSMVMHVLKENKIDFDYMVGAQIEGFDTMVSLSEDTSIAVFEGDEYLSSPVDPRPKFYLYRPHIAAITGIAWDHINVFPTFENYLQQFKNFLPCIEKGGKLFYYKDDVHVAKMVNDLPEGLSAHKYEAFAHKRKGDKLFLLSGEKEYEINVFGEHNLQNISAAYSICKELGLKDDEVLQSLKSFKGAARRLQQIEKNESSVTFQDFAHSPSKVKATVNAVRNQYPDRKLVAVLELHTFSSLNKNFLSEYTGTMNECEKAIVYYNPETISHKKLEYFPPEIVKKEFGRDDLIVFNEKEALKEFLLGLKLHSTNLLLMSSGNWSGLNMKELVNLIYNN